VCRRAAEASSVVAAIMGAEGGDEMVFMDKAGVEKETDLVASVEGTSHIIWFSRHNSSALLRYITPFRGSPGLIPYPNRTLLQYVAS
jgi:hypothetical protein